MHPTARQRIRQAAAGLLLSGTMLTTSVGAAHADQPTVINEDSTGFSCEYYPEGAPQVVTAIHYDAVSGEKYSYAQVLTPDGEGHIAFGITDEVTVADGVVSATYPLVNEDGFPAGEVVLQGTYDATAEPVTLHNRYRTARNAQIIGTVTYTELAVTWTTLQVGSYDVSGIGCSGERTQTSNRLLQPHRVVYRFEDFRLLEDCTRAPLTRFYVAGSEVGVTLEMTTADLWGHTNLALDDGNDTQDVYWFDDGGEDPVAITSITVGISPDGHSHTTVEVTSEGLVLERTQLLTFTYELGLPEDKGTVSGSCAAASVITRTAVEPID